MNCAYAIFTRCLVYWTLNKKMNQQEAKYFVPNYYCAQLKLVYTAKEYQGLNAGRHEYTNYDEVLNSIPSFVRSNPDIYLQIYTLVKAQANDLVTESWAGKIKSEEDKFQQEFLIPILKKLLEDISLAKNQDYPYYVCYKLTTSNWRFHSDIISKYEIAGIKTNQEAENLANKIVQSLANKVVKEWKDHERLLIPFLCEAAYIYPPATPSPLVKGGLIMCIFIQNWYKTNNVHCP